METSPQLHELATALAKAQMKMHAAEKDRENVFFTSSYATLASVWEACRQPLGENGLSVVQLPASAEPGRVALTTILLHSSGQFIKETLTTKIGKDDAQGVGSGITYLRRYMLSAITGITQDDDDGNDATGRGQPQPRQQQQKPPSAPPPGKPVDSKKLFLDGLADAVESRGQIDQKATTDAAIKALLDKAKMTPDTVTPKAGNNLIAAVRDGKYDVALPASTTGETANV